MYQIECALTFYSWDRILSMHIFLRFLARKISHAHRNLGIISLVLIDKLFGANKSDHASLRLHLSASGHGGVLGRKAILRRLIYIN